MAHFLNQYGAVPRTDEYGNQILQKDEHGNPIYHSTTTGDYGTGGFDTTTTTGMLGHGGTTAGTNLGAGYHDQVPRTDEYGNQIRQMDEYGNPVYHSSTIGEYGTGGFGTTTATGTLGHGGTTAGTKLGAGYHDQRHYGLQRSGSSSSSSSSEDDGHGGRRKKKGLKEKIKEKLPGVGHHKNERSQTSATTTPLGHNVTGEGRQHHHHEKKGMMEKIKEKLPGHHHH